VLLWVSALMDACAGCEHLIIPFCITETDDAGGL
jgi:hypothetical protein